ncbi:MAG: hypothetical protein Q4A69_01750 [Moraxella sp.]|nr:hypothetical protein [Moraxella sp.]
MRNKNGSSAPLMHGIGLQVSRIHAALACADNTSTDHHPIGSILFLPNTATKKHDQRHFLDGHTFGASASAIYATLARRLG